MPPQRDLCAALLLLLLCVLSVAEGGSRPDVAVPHTVKGAFFMLVHSKTVPDSLNVLTTICQFFNSEKRYDLIVFYENINATEMAAMNEQFCGFIYFHEVDFTSYPNQPPINLLTFEEFHYDKRLTSRGYCSMCRFMSGIIFTHPALQDYDYAWRLDSDSLYLAQVPYDPFEHMFNNSLGYLWVIWYHELPKSPGHTLWAATETFFNEKVLPYKSVAWTDLMANVTQPDRHGNRTMYNRNHYWNNAEIVDLNFFRGKEYQSYFEWLDKLGGFYEWRWGDALVRTLGVQMFMDHSRIERFPVAYYHQDQCTARVKGCHHWLENGDQVNHDRTSFDVDPTLLDIENLCGTTSPPPVLSPPYKPMSKKMFILPSLGVLVLAVWVYRVRRRRGH